MTSTTTSNHAMSAYAPIRRNSFLHDPASSSGSISSQLSTLSLGLTLLVIRFWKDAKIWQEILTRLPSQWQKILTANLQKWHGSTATFVKRAVRNLLQTLQEQLTPFLLVMPTGSNKQQQQQQQQQQDAPTSIVCDGSSTATAQFTTVTAAPWSDCSAYEDRIRQNQSLIRKVLGYWFGQYEPDQAQKKLWMIAASSVDLRKQVDAEIADLFTPLLLELASSSSSSAGSSMQEDNKNTNLLQTDETTTAKSQTLIQQQQQQQPGRWQQWCADKDIYGYAGKLAAIVLLDQFSRHIRRHQQEQEQDSSSSFQQHQSSSSSDNNNKNDNNNNNNSDLLPPQSQLDALALQTAQLFTEGHAQEIHCGMIPIPQYIFGLMPYRHANTLSSVKFVQTCVEQAATLNVQLEGMTSRFRKATNRRMAVLQDEARRTGQAQATTTMTTTINTRTNTAELEAGGEAAEAGATKAATTATNNNHFSDEDILETFPFEADMTDAVDHPVVKTIQSFLTDRGIYPIGGRNAALKNTTATNQKKKNSSNNKGNKKGSKNKKPPANPQPHQQQQQQPQQIHDDNNLHTDEATIPTTTLPPPPTPCSVIVSLSGGVDSMVIASVLAHLKSHLGYPHLNIVAIHIDYANRPESQAESDYVQKYCTQKGIRFVVRRIEEVTRGITARDEYEQRARQVRYDMYRSVAQECSSTTTQHDEDEPQYVVVVGVMLGHHRGDLRENVLSNAHKGCGPLDLSGMTPVSQNDGVTIYRPLLPLEKTEVYDYAHRYGVPYFKDTTPHWSTRGKLRNKLLPLLEEIYGEGSMNNLSTLATESDECRDMLHNALLKPFMDRVVRTPMGIMFETAPFVAEGQGLFFWKFVLREVLHSAGLGMFSDKSVVSFLERIRPIHTYKKTIREGWLQCRRDYAVYLQEDGKIFVFYPDSFPWRKSDWFKCQGEVFDTEKQSTIAVGPWIIEAEQCEVQAEERADLLKRKAVGSMTQFMEGFIEYYLEVPTTRKEKTEDQKLYTPSPLVFAPAFRKETRPSAWKNTDEKIQEILPLLGLSEQFALELKCPTSDNPVALVRVTLDRRFSSD